MTDENLYAPYFEIPLADIAIDWKEGAKSFFGRLGYELKTEEENLIILKAGSKIWNVLSANPVVHWRQARIVLEGETLKFQLKTSIDSRIIPEVDASYINWEAASFIGFLTGEISDIPSQPKMGRMMLQTAILAVKSIVSISVITVCVVVLSIYGIQWGFYLIEKIKANITGFPQINLNEYMDSVEQAKIGIADVYLMPFYGFSESLAAALASKLSKDLNINVRTTTALPIPDGIYNNNREQYDAQGFYKPQINAACTLGDLKKDTVFIGLVHGSIYMPGTPFRFLFAVQFDPKFSVVGDYEMRNIGVHPESLYHTRLYKIVKRQIGKTYYNKKPTSIPGSLMKSPLMSTLELDALGMEF